MSKAASNTSTGAATAGAALGAVIGFVIGHLTSIDTSPISGALAVLGAFAFGVIFPGK